MSDKLVYCSHGINGKMEERLWVEDKVFSGLRESETQISLVNLSVVREL